MIFDKRLDEVSEAGGLVLSRASGKGPSTRIFRVGAVLTGPGQPLIPDVAVETREGVITRLIPRRELVNGEEVVDLGDSVLAPGIVDAHVHLGFDGSPHPEGAMLAGDVDALADLVAFNAQALLRSGVTTVRDLGCVGTVVSHAARRWRSDARYPRVVAANQPLTVTGGHCAYMATECDDLETLLKAVSLRHDEGASVVKVMLTGGFMHPEGDTPFRPVYDLETLSLLVCTAHDLGMSVAAHAHGVAGVRLATRSGVDSIEHSSMAVPGGIEVDPALLRDMVAESVVAVPTVSSLWEEPLPWASRSDAIAVISQLHAAGVTIALGTDTGIPGVHPGDHVAGMKILAAAGMNGDEVWDAATRQAARLCGLSQTIGQIRPGFSADFIAVTDDPRHNLSVLSDPIAVVCRGLPL